MRGEGRPGGGRSDPSQRREIARKKKNVNPTLGWQTTWLRLVDKTLKFTSCKGFYWWRSVARAFIHPDMNYHPNIKPMSWRQNQVTQCYRLMFQDSRPPASYRSRCRANTNSRSIGEFLTYPDTWPPFDVSPVVVLIYIFSVCFTVLISRMWVGIIFGWSGPLLLGQCLILAVPIGSTFT